MKKLPYILFTFAILQILHLWVNATPSKAATFYVSRNGNNGGGTSWANAWNELNQINWGTVNPRDTILLDGGSTPCPATGLTNNNYGMVYNSTPSIGKPGTVTNRLI